MIIKGVDCFMLKDDMFGHNICVGNIDMTICSQTCPFRHSLEEQKDIENDIVDSLFQKRSKIDYKSRITGDILYKGEYGA